MKLLKKLFKKNVHDHASSSVSQSSTAPKRPLPPSVTRMTPPLRQDLVSIYSATSKSADLDDSYASNDINTRRIDAKRYYIRKNFGHPLKPENLQKNSK